MHVTQEQLDAWIELFDGNHQAVGKVWGEAVDLLPTDTWRMANATHLTESGDQYSLGVYPLVKKFDLRSSVAATLLEETYGFKSDLWVKWGCTDLDEGYEQSANDAQTVCAALNLLGLVGYVERTKGKGYHVWVFMEEWVPAEVMRRALLAAHQLAGIRPQEVNPKQTSLDGLKGYGNYVNLPYFAGAEPTKRVILHEDWSGDMDLDSFLEDVHTNGLMTFPTLLVAAQLYVEPPPKVEHDIVEYDGSLDDLTKKLNGLAFIIFRDGPLEGHDRSDTLAKFCHKAAESGLSEGECMTLLRNADKRWGKFHDRPDCDIQLEKLVHNAY